MTYRSEGPHAKWDYFKKLHSALQVISLLGKHMEAEFSTGNHGLRHGVPKKNADVKLLQDSYQAAKVHEYIKGHTQTGSKRDKYPDFISNGLVKLQTATMLFTWVDGRNFWHSHIEDWEDDVSDNSGEEVGSTNSLYGTSS